MYEVGSWFVYLMNGAILAIVCLFGLIAVLVKRSQHGKEANGKILAEVWLPTGRAVKGLVAPKPDGWVSLGKLGDYKLATPKKICKCGHDEVEHEITTTGKEVKDITRGRCGTVGCVCAKFDLERTLAPIRRWAKYPSNPFLGLGTLQVDVMAESWWLNNSEPITPTENRTLVTAVDAAFHTRHSEAEQAGVEIQEQEARQKQLQEALTNQPNKMIVYVMIGAAILVGVIALIRLFQAGM